MDDREQHAVEADAHGHLQDDDERGDAALAEPAEGQSEVAAGVIEQAGVGQEARPGRAPSSLSGLLVPVAQQGVGALAPFRPRGGLLCPWTCIGEAPRWLSSDFLK